MREIRALKWMEERSLNFCTKAVAHKPVLPTGKTVLAVASDLCQNLLFFCWGAIFVGDLLRHLQWGVITIAVVVLALAVVTAGRNYWDRKISALRQRLIDAQEAEIKRLLEENRKLKNVALAALALSINMEHGFPPRPDMLKRYLDILGAEKKEETEKLPGHKE